MHSSSIRDACFRGCCPTPILCLLESESPTSKSTASSTASRYFFVEAAASSLNPNIQFTNHESLPSLHESFSNFTRAFPNYSRKDEPDHIRAQEYNHLTLCNHVCLDYIGHGLFSHAQHQSHSKKALGASSSSSSPPPSPQFPEAPNFRITYKSVNLNSQILYGGQESEIELKLRIRIMAFMNISQVDYTMVFTANQSSAFKLLAECYPFQSNRNLLTVYDYENEAVEVMAESSKKKGARIMSSQFSWPNLSIQSRKLRKMIMKSRNKGLFVFPLQSRMTGSRYSYQWMSIAQENGWHVLLDACALGPKDMDTLGLSLFKPDFVICSFYKVFGEVPSGFGCLFVKKSSASILKDSTTATSIGIVSLVAASRTSQFLEEQESTDMEIEPRVKFDLWKDDLAMLHSFADPLSVQQRSETSKSHEIEEVSTKQKTISCSKSMESEDDVAVPQSVSGSLSFQQNSGKNSKSREGEEAFVKQNAVSFSETMGLETPFESARSKYPDGSINGSSEIECRGLDHADSLGLVLISTRARYLVNWLVNALMSLQHPHSESGHPLVRIYGPKINFDRGPAVAFNVFDWKGEKIDPSIVQKLADRKNISLSSGVLHHICFSDKYEEAREKALERRRIEVEGMVITKKGQIPVVTAALSFLTNFEDIYRLWAFVSQFLDADFVEKERWRYMALNQKKVEV